MAGQRHQEATSGEHEARIPLPWGLLLGVFRDWSRRQHRRACMQRLSGQRLEVQMAPPLSASPDVSPSPLSRAQRAHSRLSFQERLARNARAPTAGRVTISLLGVPEDFACWLGLEAGLTGRHAASDRDLLCSERHPSPLAI